jgi:DNA transformation protein
MAGGFQDLLDELFAPLGGVTIKRMFGGLGVFKEGMMFALVSDDVLYLKADESTAPRFEAEGYGRWVYPGHERAVAMPYWQAPERLLDDAEEFTEWARSAFGVAERNRAKSGAKRKPKPKTIAKAKPAAKKAKPKSKPKGAGRR